MPKLLPSHSLVCSSRWRQVIGAVVRRIEADAGQPLRHGFVDVGQQALTVRHAGQHAEVGLGHAVGEIGALGFAPSGGNTPVLQHDARDTAARMHRPAQAVVRRQVVVMNAPVRQIVKRIARPADFVCNREIDRVAEALLGIHGLHCTQLGSAAFTMAGMKPPRSLRSLPPEGASAPFGRPGGR